MPRLEVPYYAQSAEFSCGAACLVMALAHLRDGPADRSQEFELWREATMVGIRGIDQWGLAVPPLRRGVPATVVASQATTFAWDAEGMRARLEAVAERFPEEEVPRFTATDVEVARFNQEENHRRAEAAGVRWVRRAPTRGDLASALEQGAVPVVLVDLDALGGDWPAPHWVVAVELEGERVRLLDPDDEGPGERRMGWDAFEAAMDVSPYEAEPTIVVLGSWEPPET